MGWTNYIVIPSLKLAIEISRNVDDIYDHESEGLENVVNKDDIYGGECGDGELEYVDIGNIEINKLTVRHISTLYRAYETVRSIEGIDVDKLLLFWLKNRMIEYYIKSEFDVNVEKLKSDGYIVIRKD